MSALSCVPATPVIAEDAWLRQAWHERALLCLDHGFNFRGRRIAHGKVSVETGIGTVGPAVETVVETVAYL